MMGKTFLAAMPALAMVLASPAMAQDAPASTTIPGRVVVMDQCIFTDLATVTPRTTQTPEIFGAVLGPLLASLAGDAAKGAITELGSAIRRASQAHAFTLVGTDGYLAGDLRRWETMGVSEFGFQERPKCLILYQPSTSAEAVAQFNAFVGRVPAGRAELSPDLASGRLTNLRDVGISRAAPASYIEVALVPRLEGMLIRPMFVWYREPLGNAGRQARTAELLIELATPSYSDDGDELGTLFSLARLPLSRLQPGAEPLWPESFTGLAASYHPNRADAGMPAELITSLESADQKVQEATLAQRDARRAEQTARRALADEDNAENRNALEDALHLVTDTTNELAVATARRQALLDRTGTANASVRPALAAAPAGGGPAPTPTTAPPPIVFQDGGTFGATNVRASFIVMRDANRFGMAVADLFGAERASAVGEAVTGAMARQDPWRPEHAAMLTAILDVQAKEAEYAAAVAEGDATKIRDARAALFQAKASANTAAVALRQPRPYPDLLADAAAPLP